MTQTELREALAKERALCDLVAAALAQVMEWVEYGDGDVALADYYATRDNLPDEDDVLASAADYFNV